MSFYGADHEDEERGSYHPAPRIAFISDAEQEMVPVGRAEIRRFADEVLTVIRNPLDNLSAWAIGCWGTSVTAMLSLATLYGTKSKTSQPQTWVLAAHWVVMLTFAGVGFICWWVDHKLGDEQMDSCKELSDRIRAVDKRAPVVSNADPTAGP
jgi:hypothetical protein